MTVVAGQAPTQSRVGDSWLASISQVGARQFGLDIGDRYCLADPAGVSFCVQVAAMWQAKDPASTY